MIIQEFDLTGALSTPILLEQSLHHRVLSVVAEAVEHEHPERDAIYREKEPRVVLYVTSPEYNCFTDQDEDGGKAFDLQTWEYFVRETGESWRNSMFPTDEYLDSVFFKTQTYHFFRRPRPDLKNSD